MMVNASIANLLNLSAYSRPSDRSIGKVNWNTNPCSSLPWNAGSGKRFVFMLYHPGNSIPITGESVALFRKLGPGILLKIPVFSFFLLLQQSYAVSFENKVLQSIF